MLIHTLYKSLVLQIVFVSFAFAGQYDWEHHFSEDDLGKGLASNIKLNFTLVENPYLRMTYGPYNSSKSTKTVWPNIYDKHGIRLLPKDYINKVEITYDDKPFISIHRHARVKGQKIELEKLSSKINVSFSTNESKQSVTQSKWSKGWLSPSISERWQKNLLDDIKQKLEKYKEQYPERHTKGFVALHKKRIYYGIVAARYICLPVNKDDRVIGIRQILHQHPRFSPEKDSVLFNVKLHQPQRGFIFDSSFQIRYKFSSKDDEDKISLTSICLTEKGERITLKRSVNLFHPMKSPNYDRNRIRLEN